MSSNCVRSLVKPALHVGEQIGGGVGWRAWAGSAGMAGGSTAGGGEAGETLAQPLTSISSGISISARALHGLVGFIGGFLHLCGAALFFGAGGLHGFAAGALEVGDVLGVLCPGVGVRGLLASQAPGLDAGQQQSGGQQASQDAHDHSQPRYFGERISKTSATWCRLMSQALRPA
jgi:hypothetical protein